MGKKKEKNLVKVISGMLRLIKQNTPVMLLWHCDGELKKIGTGNVSNWFDSLSDENKKNLNSSMVKDIVSISNKSEELAVNPESVPFSVRASSIFKSLTSPVSVLPLLPFSLSLMNKKEKSKYICDRIAEEARAANVKVVYGLDTWVPSFWPESLWSWSNLKQTLGKTNEKDYTGGGSYSEFLEKIINVILEADDLDPESYVMDIENKSQTLRKKERARGINKEPCVVRVADQENNDDFPTETPSNQDQRGTQNFSNNVLGPEVSQFEHGQGPFKPRRYVGISPFKIPKSSLPSSRIPLKNLDTSPVTPSGRVPDPPSIPVDVVEQLEDHCLGVHSVVKNSGGGSCLFKSVSQFLNSSLSECSYLDLRRFTHQKMIDWWWYFQNFYYWPMQITVGTGDAAVMKTFETEVQFKEFLLSEESMESFNETAVELWALCYILNCKISVLCYGLPVGQGQYDSRWRWTHFNGKNVVPDISGNEAFVSNSNLILLNEHTQHWALVSGCLNLNYPNITVDSFPTGVVEPDDVEVYKFPELLSDQIGADPEVSSSYHNQFDQQIVDNSVVGTSPSPADQLHPSDTEEASLSSSSSMSTNWSQNHTVKEMQTEEAKVVQIEEEVGKEVCKKVEIQTEEAKKKVDAAEAKKKNQVDKKAKVSKMKDNKLGGANEEVQQRLQEVGVKKKTSGERKRKRKFDDTVIPSKITIIPEQLVARDSYIVQDMVKDLDISAIVQKSDIYHKFPLREKTVEEILASPEPVEVAKEQALDALDEEIRESQVRHEEEMKSCDAVIAKEKLRQRLRRKRFKENNLRRDQLEAELTEDIILRKFEDLQDLLVKIRKAEVHSARHEAFHRGGSERIALDGKVFDGLLSDDKINLILALIDKLFGFDLQEKILNSNYTFKVLLPEFLIKVYMGVFNIADQKKAQQMMYETPIRAEDQSEDSDTFDSD